MPASLSSTMMAACGVTGSGALSDAAGFVEAAVKGTAAVEVVAGVAKELAGKTVIDTTNPMLHPV